MAALDLRDVRTVFLDRDGTINVKAAEGEYIMAPAEIVLLPGAAKAVAALNAAGLRAVLVTNQRWLSKQSANPTLFAAVQDRLVQLLADEGAWLDATYHCPHAADSCDCRKPLPGMLLQAAREHGLDLAKSVMIGDSDVDVMAGKAAGTATVLLRSGGGDAAGADAVVKDLAAAVQLILGAKKSRRVRRSEGCLAAFERYAQLGCLKRQSNT